MARLPFIDFIRAVAATLIVWHHLAFYGPLSDIAQDLAPGVIDWLYEYARWAVQAFLVLGGYMTARSLAPGGVSRITGVSAAIVKRWRRTVVPYLVVLVVALVANAVADHFMDHESVSPRPTVPQLLAHVTLLHDLLGYDSVSAGLWYVAIDLQLFVLSVLLIAWLRGRWLVGAIVMLAVVSIVAVNRIPSLDSWAPYFFGAYAIGILAAWSGAGRLPWAAFLNICTIATLAALFDDRPRLLVAVATGVSLVVAERTGVLSSWPRSSVVSWLGRTSYSLFLVHFPICLVVNALLWDVAAGRPLVAALGMAIAWALSLGGSALFHRHVELRAMGMLSARA